MALIGIDVSKYQQSVDWAKVAASGVAFGIARASIGGLQDPYFAANKAGMQKHMKVWGAYHYLYPAKVVSIDTQARAFKRAVGNPEGGLLVVDVEWHSKDGAYKVSAYEARSFVQRVRELYGQSLRMLLYTGRWYWVGWLGDPKIGGGIAPLWASHYVSRDLSGPPGVMYRSVPSYWWNQLFGGWTTMTMLQFTSAARVPGVTTGVVDANAYRGTLSQLRALTGIIGAPDTATEEPMAIYRYEERPGVFTIPAGKQVRGWEPTATGWAVAKTWAPHEAASKAPYAGYVRRLSGDTLPSVLVLCSGGYFDGLYISTAEVDEIDEAQPDLAAELAAAQAALAQSAADVDRLEEEVLGLQQDLYNAETSVAVRISDAITADRAKARVGVVYE